MVKKIRKMKKIIKKPHNKEKRNIRKWNEKKREKHPVNQHFLCVSSQWCLMETPIHVKRSINTCFHFFFVYIHIHFQHVTSTLLYGNKGTHASASPLVSIMAQININPWFLSTQPTPMLDGVEVEEEEVVEPGPDI